MDIYRSRLGPAGIAGLIIVVGFLITSVTSYVISTRSAKETVLTVSLPLTSDNVYSEIQRDLLRPVFVSSLMASDTFLREWVIEGEADDQKIRRYLKEIKDRYNAVTSFFVSERTSTYYHAEGVLKKVSPDEPRDSWYYRVRVMKDPYEINVDPDMANKDAMTIFINYKVVDFKGELLGATGVGLTVGAVKELIEKYQARFGRTIYFADRQGRVVLHGSGYRGPMKLSDHAGLRPHLPTLSTEQGKVLEFSEGGETILLSARFIPELDWLLLVEQPSSELLKEFNDTLKGSLVICAIVTVLVVLLSRRTVNHFQGKISELALTDGLTEIPNRRAFSVSFGLLRAKARRKPEAMSLLMVDLDHFKEVNDKYGHLCGDLVLKQAASILKERLRESDLLCRWGGEEFLILLNGADLDGAKKFAEEIRQCFEKSKFGDRGSPMGLTVSVGLAECAPEDTEISVVSKADHALYLAKERGRNRVEAHSGAVPGANG